MKEIFLVPFAGTQYGIRKDDIRSVRSLDALHRIPLSPACIAGIMIEGEQTVTLANLPVCICSSSGQEIRHGCILLTEADDRLMGFVVDGELSTQPISPQLLFPLPDYLKTTAFDACAVHDNIPIPLINIADIGSHMLKPGEDTSMGFLRISGDQPLNISGMKQIRLFSIGGELFAAPAAGMEEIAIKPGPITPLPNTPRYVKGITFNRGHLLPVIDLSQRIKWQSGSPEPLMLVTKIRGATFGLLTDSDEGVVLADRVAIDPVPVIAQTSWLKHMIVRKGELIPLIDLAMSLSHGSVDDEKPLWQRYTLDSVFSGDFFKREVEVVEFLLLGERYALPKKEVEDVISFMPCRALPDAPSIVIGVAMHNGEILPVVDLAMMFGRRSLTTTAWRMILVSNGTFRALVVTSAVAGERRLPPDIHRTVPIHLPHNLMYGCYPDGNAARIILNVAAISVYFEKSLIKKFLPSLSQEMMMSPTGAHALSGENTSAAPQTLPTDTPTAPRTEAELWTSAKTMTQPTTIAPLITIAPASAEKAPIHHEDAWSEPESKPEPELVQIEVASDVANPADTHLPQSTTGGISAHSTTPEPAHAIKHEAPAETLSENIAAPEAQAANAELSNPVCQSHNTINRQRVDEYTATLEPAASEIPLPSVTMIAPAQIPGGLPQNNPAQIVTAPTHPQAGHAQIFMRPSGIQLPTATADGNGTSFHASDESAILKPAFLNYNSNAHLHNNREVDQLSKPPDHGEQTPGPWRRRIAYGLITAPLIAVLFYFLGASDKRSLEKPVTASLGTARTEQAAGLLVKPYARPAPVKTEAGLEAKHQQALAQQTKAQAELPHSMDKNRAPLELVIPKNMPKVDIDEYVVVRGDTLWSISKRFTGNPFNFPRIAGGNQIANPDLIFPGQRISLIK